VKISGFTSLSAPGVGLLSDVQKAVLASLWVDNVEEAVSFVAAAEYANVESEVLVSIRAALAPFMLALPEEELARWGGVPHPPTLGCRVEPETMAAYAATGRVTAGRASGRVSGAPLPVSVRLMDRLGPVKAQGERGTCVAFALVGLREYLLEEPVRLSEQHMYWGCKQRDGFEDEAGSTIHDGLSALRAFGVCPEADWPYSDAVIVHNESHGPVPAQAAKAAKGFRMQHTTAVSRSNVVDIKQVLAGVDAQEGMPVAISVLVFNSWLHSHATQQTGKITMPLPGEEPQGGHAMLVVGYQEDTSAPGGGYLILRNSWSSEWAGHSPEAPGHAVMPYSYFERFAMEAYAGEVRAAAAPQVLAEKGLQFLTLEEDARDKYGKLLRAGCKVVVDPRDAGSFLKASPANIAEFSPHANAN